METLYIEFFAALFAIMNPFTNLPIFLSLTSKQPEKRVKIASVMAIAITILLTLLAFTGSKFLNIFGIKVSSFEIAGGVIVFMIAYSMLHTKKSRMHNSTSEERKEANAKDSPAIVPLTVPLLCGPGTITTMIVYTNKFGSSIGNYSALLAATYSIILIIWVVFCFGTPIAKMLGHSGMNIITRVMAIILASIGVNMIINGLKVAFSL